MSQRTLVRSLIAIVAMACLWVAPAEAKSKNTHHAAHARKAKHSRHHRGQQAIQQDRAREIQTALIREHYLDGEPSGVWDQRTQSAMARYQADNGWQTKMTPDSRALIKLGLGPRNDGLLNPETAAAPSAPTPAMTNSLVEGKVASGTPQRK